MPTDREQKIQEIRDRRAKLTSVPWEVWDGPEYQGGGRDLCIGGPGKAWLANMHHRRCVNGDAHMASYVKASCEPEAVMDVCELSDEITEEQLALAQFIAHAPTDIDVLLAIAEARRQEIVALTMAAFDLAKAVPGLLTVDKET